VIVCDPSDSEVGTVIVVEKCPLASVVAVPSDCGCERMVIERVVFGGKPFPDNVRVDPEFTSKLETEMVHGEPGVVEVDRVGDGGVVDGGAEDGGVVDGGVEDGGVDDGGVEDGGVDDGGVEDGGVDDGGVDEGGPDEGPASCTKLAGGGGG
jgi:hypothetical protein